jgi:hypothetical protein
MFVATILIAASVVAQSVLVPERPDFDAVQKAMAEHFASLKAYRSGDLLNQSQVADVLDAVESTGWAVPDREAIVKLAPADNSFLVQAFSTANGRRFMRQIANYPGSYSRLDRLSTVSDGKRLIKALIAKKGGADIIQYLATTRGGRNLGAMMVDVPHGVDLNKPTGRIYTQDDLLTVVEKVYNSASGHR